MREFITQRDVSVHQEEHRDEYGTKSLTRNRCGSLVYAMLLPSLPGFHHRSLKKYYEEWEV
jgi:hypothetical protein